MVKPLSVPFQPQIENGYCLAACAQMVMAYYGRAEPQLDWSQKLEIRPGLGAPAPNIKNLATRRIQVEYGEGNQQALANLLAGQIPVIAFVQGGDLPHWPGEVFQHAVVVTGLEGSSIFMMDPALPDGPVKVSLEAFLLAWSGMDYLMAAIYMI